MCSEHLIFLSSAQSNRVRSRSCRLVNLCKMYWVKGLNNSTLGFIQVGASALGLIGALPKFSGRFRSGLTRYFSRRNIQSTQWDPWRSTTSGSIIRARCPGKNLTFRCARKGKNPNKIKIKQYHWGQSHCSKIWLSYLKQLVPEQYSSPSVVAGAMLYRTTTPCAYLSIATTQPQLPTIAPCVRRLRAALYQYRLLQPRRNCARH